LIQINVTVMAKPCSMAFRFAAVILAAGTHLPNPAAAQNVNQPVTPQPSPYVVESPPTQAPGIRRPSTWEAQLIETLSQNKRYPSDAVSRGEQGTAIVSFTLDRSGNLLNSQIKQSSGYASLDREAVELLSRINRFPPFPTDFQKDTVTLTIPIKFRIGGKLAQAGTAPTVNPGASSAPVPSSISSGQSVATASNPQTSQPSGERVSQGAKAEAEAEQVKVQQATVEAEREKARAKQAEAEAEKAKAQAQQAKAEADRAKAEAEQAKVQTRRAEAGAGIEASVDIEAKRDIKGYKPGMTLAAVQAKLPNWSNCETMNIPGLDTSRYNQYGCPLGAAQLSNTTRPFEVLVFVTSKLMSPETVVSVVYTWSSKTQDPKLILIPNLPGNALSAEFARNVDSIMKEFSVTLDGFEKCSPAQPGVPCMHWPLDDGANLRFAYATMSDAFSLAVNAPTWLQEREQQAYGATMPKKF
jgi:TonB family protein